MLDTTPRAMLQDFEASQKLRDLHLANTRKLVQKFFGNWYRTDQRSQPVPENLIFSYLASVLPQIVIDNPKFTIKAARAVTHAPVAQWMKHGLDQWAMEINLDYELMLIAIDYLLSYGVAKIGLESRGDFIADPSKGVYERMQMKAMKPYLIRISPDKYLIDPKARRHDEARFLAHEFERDLDELARDERYDPQIVAQLTPDGDDTNVHADAGRLETVNRSIQAAQRRRVKLYEVYVPESRRIGTLAVTGPGGAQWVRPLIEYVGHEDGPFVTFGCYPVPNHVYPLSPIAAMAEQFTDLNAHTVAAAIEATSHKKLVAVDANVNNAVNVIMDAPSGSVVQIPGFNPQTAMNIELGGTSESRMAYIGQLRERLDRVIGFSDAQRGRAQGVTATEADIAADAGKSRMSFITSQFRKSVRTSSYRVGWWMFYEQSVVQPVSWLDRQSGREKEGLFLGGIQEGQEDMMWLDFMLDIEPMSMGRVDPAQQAAIADAAMNVAVTVAPMIVQFPWINWRALLDLIGDARNIPNFCEIVLTQGGLEMMGQAYGAGQLFAANPAQDFPMAAASLPPNASQELFAGLQGAPVNLSPRRPLSARPVAASMPRPGMGAPPLQAMTALGLVRPGRGGTMPGMAGQSAGSFAA